MLVRIEWLNSKIGFWKRMEIRSGIKFFEWSCGCAGNVLDDTMIEVSFCEEHYDKFCPVDESGVPKDLREAVLGILSRRKKR